MTNLLVVLDPDAPRRTAFLARAERHLSSLPGLSAVAAAAGDVSVLGALHPTTPWDRHVENGALAFTLGLGRRADDALARLREGKPGDDDGYGATVAWDLRKGLRIGADLLGLHPIFWWTDGEVLLAGTTPNPFRHHPRFRAVLDPEGLVGILLTNGLIGGRTAWKGVRRLDPAHAVVRPPGESAREEVQWEPRRVPVPRRFEDAVEYVQDVVDRAVRHHVPPDSRVALALSGGLDSRLVLGLVRRAGHSVHAVTAGVEGDLELSIARRVAAKLGVPHTTLIDRAGEFRRDLEIQIAWDHGASGHALAFGRSLSRALGSVGDRVLSGVCWDAMIGGNPEGWGGGADAFDPRRFLDRVFAWGVPSPTLTHVLRPEVFGDAVAVVLDRVERSFKEWGPDDPTRARVYYRTNRIRFQAGAFASMDAFHLWPMMPFDDREVIEVTQSLVPGHVDRRRLQSEILRRHFPELARLPLDRNSFETIPPAPSWWDRLTAGRRRHRHRRRRRRGIEPRRYYRIFDPDWEGWKDVRRRVEPLRDAARALFRPDVLDELLPPPDAPIPSSGDRILATNGVKILIGTLLWWAGPSGLA